MSRITHQSKAIGLNLFAYDLQFIFTDVQNRVVFTTRNFGDNFNSTLVSFSPDEVIFDPLLPNNVVAYEKTGQKEVSR